MFNFVKRSRSLPAQQIKRRLLTILMALGAAAVILFLMGYNPLTIYKEIILGALGSSYRLKETILKAVPLLIMALGVSVCLKMNFINIGAEGQFYIGACAATFIALNFSYLPRILLLPLMFISAFLFGGIWCLIPALFKIKIGTNEILVTLMLNYIAIKLVSYLQYGPWKDANASGFPRIAAFQKSAVLPQIGGLHIGVVIALLLVILTYLLLAKSKLGYEITVLGKSPVTAQYAGMHVAKIVICAVLIGGGISGMAGMIQASAIEKSLTDQLSAGLGYTAIITAWLGNLSAPVILCVSFAFAILIQGSMSLQTSLQIPSSMADILQGVILIFVLSGEVFSSYQLKWSASRQEGI